MSFPNKKVYRLAILTSHPIQYQVPLFRKLSQHPQVNLTVYFCWDFGVEEAKIDPGFGVPIKWDIPMLDRYYYRFLSNYSFKPSEKFWGQINPAIFSELRKNRYDAILVHGYASVTNWFAFLASWMTNTPILLRGESHLLYPRRWWVRAIKNVILTALFRGTSAFLTIGAHNAHYYQHYGVPSEKLFLTPYSVDNAFFQEQHQIYSAKKAEIKSSLGIPVEIPVILYASKMIPRKRAMDLLQAYTVLIGEVEAALVFVGDGVQRPMLEDYVNQHRLNNIHFVGFKNQTELPAFFAIADVFVLPSTNEPWGLIINEVMNSGVPVIATEQVGSAIDLVRNGENGFIYSVGDIDALANYLRQILISPERRETMGKRSLEIIQTWDYDACIQGILAALTKVVK